MSGDDVKLKISIMFRISSYYSGWTYFQTSVNIVILINYKTFQLTYKIQCINIKVIMHNILSFTGTFLYYRKKWKITLFISKTEENNQLLRLYFFFYYV